MHLGRDTRLRPWAIVQPEGIFQTWNIKAIDIPKAIKADL